MTNHDRHSALSTAALQVPNARLMLLNALGMTDAAERLRLARIAAGYDTARDAAKAMGVSDSSYTQHENGIRGFPKDKAQQYARFFKTTPEWLIYGRGKGDPLDPSIDELEAMVRDALSEVLTLDTRIADLPRIVAPSLHEQLERFRVDRAALHGSDQGTVRGTGARLHPATKRSERAE